LVKSEERRALERQILEKLAMIRGRVTPETVEALRRAVTPSKEPGQAMAAVEPLAKPSAHALAAMKAYKAGRGR